MPGNYTIDDANAYFDSFEDFLYANKEKYDLRSVETRFSTDWGQVRAYLNKPPQQDWWQVVGLALGRKLGLVKNGVMTREKVIEDVKENALQRAGIEMRTRWRQETASQQGTMAVVLYGDDTDRLTELSHEVERRLRAIPGLLDVGTELEDGVDEVRLRLNREQATKFGVNPQAVAGTISYALRGVELPDYRTEDREVDIRVQMRSTFMAKSIKRWTASRCRAAIRGTKASASIACGKIRTPPITVCISPSPL